MARFSRLRFLDLYPPGIEMLRGALQTLEQGGALSSSVQQPTIPSTPITNLNVSYDFGRHLRLSAGAIDLFDRKPPHLNGKLLAHYDSFAYGDNQHVQGYPSFSPFGINGGSYYASALFTF